jgi:hypothetical protein
VSRVAQLQLVAGRIPKDADPPQPVVIGAWKDLGKRHIDHRGEVSVVKTQLAIRVS